MKMNDTITSLPSILPLNLSEINGPILFVGAIGFEDRAFTVIEEIDRIKKPIARVVGIKYKPINLKNRTEQFDKIIDNLGITDKTEYLVYDRYAPDDFAKSARKVQLLSSQVSSVIIDISAMSKFLIIVLLESLINTKTSIYIVYTEAKKYFPLKNEYYRCKLDKPEKIPEFLTTSIYNIVTTRSLSSSSMQGYPLLMIAFPTFNQKELFALINELSPKSMVLLEGKPHEARNFWRTAAIRWLNQRIKEYVLKNFKVSTFDYKETLETLEIIYNQFMYTHKIVIAPTGSKLQTFGVFLFKQMHPDVQLVYPVTKEFAEEYTKGSRASWQIIIPDLLKLSHELSKHRKKELSDLENLIKLRSR